MALNYQQIIRESRESSTDLITRTLRRSGIEVPTHVAALIAAEVIHTYEQHISAAEWQALLRTLDSQREEIARHTRVRHQCDETCRTCPKCYDHGLDRCDRQCGCWDEDGYEREECYAADDEADRAYEDAGER